MSDPLIDRLAGTLTPVSPRRASREIALLAGLVLAEVALMLVLGMTRADLGSGMVAMEAWKIAAPACVAVVATLLAVRSGDPARRRVGMGAIGLVGAAALAAGLSLPAVLPAAPDGIGQALRPVAGLACVLVATVLACPPALALGLVLRSAAPAHPRQTALAAGLAAGAFGATLLGLHCPDDSALHSLVWHPLGILAPALAATLPITRAIRW